ncbi:hypothetical protein GJ496_010251 [Pomphorhynchus laevis]|nr:hypothetical protein GJ496_010251 [Pomphorhynchus laevis]
MISLAKLPGSNDSGFDEDQLRTHLNHFMRQFILLHPDRINLTLFALNELNEQQFLCKTVCRKFARSNRFINGLLWQELAQTMSDFFMYDTFIDKFRLLSFDHFTNSSRHANALEISTYMCSLLISRGYLNCFVAQGYAHLNRIKDRVVDLIESCQICSNRLPNEQFYQSTNMLDALWLTESSVNLPNSDVDKILDLDETKSRLWNVRPSVLDLLTGVGQIKTDQNNNMYRRRIERESYTAANNNFNRVLKYDDHLSQNSNDNNQSEVDLDYDDVLIGRRIHFWVVLHPPELGEFVFIDPVTGSHSIAELSLQQYQGVEGIWNDRNYWINMQHPSHIISFNLQEITEWEPIFRLLDFKEFPRSQHGDKIDDVCKQLCHSVMAPIHNPILLLQHNPQHPLLYQETKCKASTDHEVSVICPRYICNDYRQERDRSGNKLRQRFGANSRQDALVERVIYFDKFEDMVEEHFSFNINRRRSLDRMIHIRKEYDNDASRYIEYFENGRSDGLKTRIMDSESSNLEECTMFFDEMNRFDSLRSRELRSNRWLIEYYGSNRMDGLISRHIRLNTNEKQISAKQVSMIVDRYDKVRRSKSYVPLELILYNLHSKKIVTCQKLEEIEEVTSRVDQYELSELDWRHANLVLANEDVVWSGNRNENVCGHPNPVKDKLVGMQRCALEEYIRSRNDHSMICRLRRIELRSHCQPEEFVTVDNMVHLKTETDVLNGHCQVRSRMLESTSNDLVNQWKNQCSERYRKDFVIDLLNNSELCDNKDAVSFVRNVALKLARQKDKLTND